MSTGRLSFRPSEPEPVIRVVCRDRAHPASVTVAELQREERWDGSGGHYWVKRARMSDKERAHWDQGELGDRTALPRDYRDPRPHSGFTWLRDGAPVPAEEAYTIGQAAHHGARRHRTGTPEPGILDGVARVFELPPCSCGAHGVRAVRADVVERILDAVWARGVNEIELANLRALAMNTPGSGRSKGRGSPV